MLRASCALRRWLLVLDKEEQRAKAKLERHHEQTLTSPGPQVEVAKLLRRFGSILF